MTAGKSKRVTKKGKARKQVEPFSRKQWYDIKAPFPFKGKTFCKSPINKSAGTRIASEIIKGRVYEVSVADLLDNQSLSHVIMKLRIDDVRGKNAYTSFHGMRYATDKVRSLLKKWHTLVKTQVDARTSDGYTVRMFAISFTKRRALQLKKTTYAQRSHVLKMVSRMREVMAKSAADNEMKDLTQMLIHNNIGAELEKACSTVFPLQNTFVWKVKLLKRPKVDPAKIATLYEGYTTEVAAIEEAAAAATAAKE